MNSKKEKILVVDDVSINRMILITLLENNYEIITAENGMIAKHMIDQHRDSLSLILLDIVMPVLDGFDVLEYLKDEDLIHEIPVVLITAESTEENVIKGIKMGADDILAKPFDPNVAKPRIENILALYSQRRLSPQERKDGLKILVIGKRRRMPDETQQMFEERYEFHTLQSASQAEELLSTKNISDFIMMLDLIDEETESRKFIARLDESSLISKSRMLILIKDSVPEDLIAIVQKGIYDIVNWPFDPEVVFRRIDNISQLSGS